jgi:hypothetical protein
MRNGSDRAAKVDVASMCQGGRGRELNSDRYDRYPDHRCELPFGDHGASLTPKLWLNFRASDCGKSLIASNFCVTVAPSHHQRSARLTTLISSSIFLR